MSDELVRSALWLALFGIGAALCVFLKRSGVATTYVRDFLHVGTGLWVLGWQAWQSRWMPSLIVVSALLGVIALPLLARRAPALARFQDSVSGGDERWSGIVLYVLAYAVLTPVGLLHAPVPAATALLALSLGDGVGGAVGRRFGRLRFTAPGGKRKSVEGSATVALMAAAGAALVASWWGVPLTAGRLVLVGGIAATTEALAPRGTDNLLVPGAVWLACIWM